MLIFNFVHLYQIKWAELHSFNPYLKTNIQCINWEIYLIQILKFESLSFNPLNYQI
jgi:hypothetical protein